MDLPDHLEKFSAIGGEILYITCTLSYTCHSMVKNKQVALYLQGLQQQYPAAFKRNYLLYSQLKTKGILDELKELLPWVLAAMIFVSLSMSIGHAIENYFPDMSEFRAHGIAVVSIMLFFMLIVPIVLKQIKHSSISLYQSLKNTPFKLAIVIILQLLNIAFLQSTFVQSVLFFFAISFGFVRFYKENLFRDQSQSVEHYQLQQLRRVCFWAYKQTLKSRFKLRLSSTQSATYQTIKTQLEREADLYVQLLKYEHAYCKQIKHIDVDSYIDEML